MSGVSPSGSPVPASTTITSAPAARSRPARNAKSGPLVSRVPTSATAAMLSAPPAVSSPDPGRTSPPAGPGRPPATPRAPARRGPRTPPPSLADLVGGGLPVGGLAARGHQEVPQVLPDQVADERPHVPPGAGRRQPGLTGFDGRDQPCGLVKRAFQQRDVSASEVMTAIFP
jgi:hypothetical protein